jgi:hypothetical protein
MLFPSYLQYNHQSQKTSYIDFRQLGGTASPVCETTMSPGTVSIGSIWYLLLVILVRWLLYSSQEIDQYQYC